MNPQTSAPDRFRFGPFEVNAVTGELWNDGLRVRLAGQPFRILLALLTRAGELVTRDQLRELVWTDETFVDFEHGLNAAVNKLRRALGDVAEKPRYIETHPGRGYRFIGTLQVPETVAVVAPVVTVVAEAKARRGWFWWWVAGAAVVVSAFAVGWRMHEAAPSAATPWKVRRLTADKGITNASALSRDGKFVAYSSDRALEGASDLYVMQVKGGTPIRLTMDGAGSSNPDFSPDGSKIVFESSRDGGGVYEIGAFGGEAHLLVRHGLNPKYSPDGTEVAYWVGEPNVATTVAGSGEVWVIPVGGGPPRRVGADFKSARFPVWAPDGEHVLVNGYKAEVSSGRTVVDWWVVATHGDAAVRTGFYEAMTRSDVQSQASPTTPRATFAQVPMAGCWLAGTNSIVFSARTGPTQSLWEADISPQTNKATGNFRRLTAGAGDEVQPSCAAKDAITFTSGEERAAVWLVKADLNTGKNVGEPQLLTTSSTDREPSFSGDGRFMSFTSARSGVLNVWMREMSTGNEVQLEASPDAQRFSLPDATGRRVVYSVFEKDGSRSIYLWSRDEAPQKICEDCLRPTAWTQDGKKVLIFGGSPFRVDVVDVETHQRTPLVSHKVFNMVLGRFSPDERSISFTTRTKPNKAVIMVAPLDGTKPVAESDWIRISEEGPDDRADWSPDGKMLYFTSLRDGHKCLYAQRIDAASRRPVGEAFAVQHLHKSLWFSSGGWTAVGGKIAFGLVDGRENVWIMSRELGAR